MSALDMHRLSGAESAIRAEMDAARVTARQQLAPVGSKVISRSVRIAPDAPTVVNGYSAAEVQHRADVIRAARRLRLCRAIADAVWWAAVPAAIVAVYAIAAAHGD